MRCLTLADTLRENGAKCVFVCREHVGNMSSTLESRGFIVHTLSPLKHIGDVEPADELVQVLFSDNAGVIVADNTSPDLF